MDNASTLYLVIGLIFMPHPCPSPSMSLQCAAPVTQRVLLWVHTIPRHNAQAAPWRVCILAALNAQECITES
jgi:hypothetical protein